MPQTILITGSNAGIGKRTAEFFSQKGWTVIATMRSVEKAGDLGELPNVHIYPLDVSQTDSVQQTAQAVIRQFGKIDVVVNNAGFGVYGAVEIATEEQIDRQYDVNVRGVIRVMRAFLPHFREQQDGLFINISSVAGLITYPFGALYNSTKWAVEGLTEGMYYELRPFGIRVKLVEPGAFGTNFQQVNLNWTQSETVDVYDEVIDRIRTARAELQADLPDSIAVAETILEAANDPSERLRYLIGEDAERWVARRTELGADGFVQELYEGGNT